MVTKKLDLGPVAYTIGIIAVVMAIVNSVGGIIFGAIGLIINKDKKNPYYAKARKLNLIGLILGIIFLIISLVLAYYYPEMLLA